MMPEQEPSSLWQDKAEDEAKLTGAVTEENFAIPLGATHFAMFPQTNAVLALVLAITSFVCGGLLLSIPALFVAISAKKITDHNPAHPDRGIATAAYITSIVNICICALIILAYVAVIMIYVLA